MLALTEWLSYRRQVLACRTGLAGTTGIDRDHRPTGTRSLVGEDPEELPPSRIRHTLGKHAALEPNDIQVFDRNQIVLLHEPQRRLVMKISAVALNRAMPFGHNTHGLPAAGATAGALRHHALRLSHSRARDPQWPRVRDVLPVARREERLQTEVDPDGGVRGRQEALGHIVAGEQNDQSPHASRFNVTVFTRPSSSLDQKTRILPMPCKVSARFLPDEDTGPSAQPACLNVSES